MEGISLPDDRVRQYNLLYKIAGVPFQWRKQSKTINLMGKNKIKSIMACDSCKSETLLFPIPDIGISRLVNPCLI